VFESYCSMRKTIRKGRGGFTLIELLVVMAIIAVLSAGAIKVAQNVRLKAQKRNTQGTIAILCDALQEYFDYKGSFPAGNGEPDSIIDAYIALNELPQSEKILGKLSGTATERQGGAVVFIDAWKNELRYDNPVNGNFPIIKSAGPDGVFDSADDIISSEF